MNETSPVQKQDIDRLNNKLERILEALDRIDNHLEHLTK